MEKVNIEQLNSILELAHTVLQILCGSVIILLTSSALYWRLFYKVRDAKATGIRAHRRIDETNERVVVIEGRLYELK